MGRRSLGPKVKKRKKVTVKLIKEKMNGEQTEPYRLLAEIRHKEHAHLDDAKIALAWRLGWRADTDGRLTLGQCRKRGDLDREMNGFDFVILLNKEAWERLNEKQKRALIDHELCHAQIVMDADGSAKMNDSDRLVTRIKKHDCEEFRDIVNRHGLWKQDLEAFATAAINDAKRPLLGESEKNGNGKADKSGPATTVAAAPTNGQPATASATGNAWRKLGIDTLAGDVTEKDRDKLGTASIYTLGDLQDLLTREGTWWFKRVDGIGRAAADRVEDAFNSLVMAATEPAAK